MALVAVSENGLTLAWQFSQVKTDAGGPFIWNKPAPLDRVAERLL